MPEKIEQKLETDEFIQTGGKVLEKYSDGRSKVWKCGLRENGVFVDPQDVTKEAIHYFNEQGEWEGGNPDQELIEEIKRWRSDWADPV